MSNFSNFSLKDQQRIADDASSFDKGRGKVHGLGFKISAEVSSTTSSSSSRVGKPNPYLSSENENPVWSAGNATSNDNYLATKSNISGCGAGRRPMAIDFFGDVESMNSSNIPILKVSSEAPFIDRNNSSNNFNSSYSNINSINSNSSSNSINSDINSNHNNSNSISNSNIQHDVTRPNYDGEFYKRDDESNNKTDGTAAGGGKIHYSSSRPIFKRIKAGDDVQALYKVDYKYYPAIVKSVIHGGFTSANYDVEYIGYNECGNVSWRELRENEALVEENDDNMFIETSKAIEVSSALDSYLKKDSFGRDRGLRTMNKSNGGGKLTESKYKSDLELYQEHEQNDASLDRFGRHIGYRRQDTVAIVHVVPDDPSLKYGRKFENLLGSSKNDQYSEKFRDVMSYISINSVNDIVAEDFLLEYQGKWSKV